jgi:predicted small secreted protein
MKSSCIAALLAAAFSLSACATPYGAGDISASQIDPATLQISGRADAHTASDMIEHYLLMRAAEETTKRGFDLFLMLPSPDTATAMAWSSRSTAIASGKGGETMLVMMFHGEKPSNAPANLYRASDLLNPSSFSTDR